MSQAVRTPEEWVRLEARAVSFLVLSRIEEEQVRALFRNGFGPQCFTIPENARIIEAIRDTMAAGGSPLEGMEGKPVLLQAIATAAQITPAYYWKGVCDLLGEAHSDRLPHYETMEDFTAAMFPDFARDFKPLITRARILSPTPSP